MRGTYAGLASDRPSRTCKRLGVTAVSLLPVHSILDEQRLVELGLVNYWGYNTLGFFCPDPRYAADARDAARRVPRPWCAGCTPPGIEVILDVVYNHTAEGDERGPTLCLARPGQRQLVPPAGRATHRYDN